MVKDDDDDTLKRDRGRTKADVCLLLSLMIRKHARIISYNFYYPFFGVVCNMYT